ncbi:shortsighted class 1 [Aphelenchoides avenae]|nr:shortsighted class 1 [Aphelenchus avenae]
MSSPPYTIVKVPLHGAATLPPGTRRRHSLAPDAFGSSHIHPHNNAGPLLTAAQRHNLLTRNRRSFVFSSLNGTGSTNGSGGGSAANSQLVAIDSKIEQAMDLVKTHLMFAVREEVEILRARILELETTVIQLEAENAILREHVPSDILKNLSLQQAPGSMAQAALAQ